MLLYYITDGSQFEGEDRARAVSLLDKIAEAARWGVDFIQLREKDLAGRELESLARTAVRLVRDHTGSSQGRTRILINSRVDVAIACDADGVHLRSWDISPADVRKVWRRSAIHREGVSPPPLIGVSCHTQAEVAAAQSQGADFAVFGPVFEKKQTSEAFPGGLDRLRQACQQNIPVLALGGVTLKNACYCLASGAAGIAAIRLFQQGDIGPVVAHLRAQTIEDHC